MAVTRADGADFDAKVAGEDLSAKLNYLVKIDTDGDLVLAGSGELVYGVITEAAASGKSVTAQVSGLCKARAGAAIAANTRVMSNASGEAITATGTVHTFGFTRNAVSAAGEIVEIQIDRTHDAA